MRLATYGMGNDTPRFNEVERGVYWYHLVRLSVCLSVRLWTESYPLCIFNNTHRIHFIFAHLIKQLQNVCRVKCPLQNSKIWRRGYPQNAGVLVNYIPVFRGLWISFFENCTCFLHKSSKFFGGLFFHYTRNPRYINDKSLTHCVSNHITTSCYLIKMAPTAFQNIEVNTKRLAFHRRHFHMHFSMKIVSLTESYCSDFFPKGSINNNPAMVKKWLGTEGNKP